MTALGWCIIANFALARHGPSRHDVSVIFTTAAVRRDGGSGAVHNTHCLAKNVTGEVTAETGGAMPNRIGVADGGTDQHECAA